MEPSLPPPPLDWPLDAGAGASAMDVEAAHWFGQKLSMNVCGKRLGAQAIKNLLLGM
jgi:hypothetical protein